MQGDFAIMEVVGDFGKESEQLKLEGERVSLIDDCLDSCACART